METIAIKQKIRQSIQAFSDGNLTDNALQLFQTIGYNTQRQSPLDKPCYDTFKDSFIDLQSKFNEAKALVKDWKYVDLLFQLSKEEISHQISIFDTTQVDRTVIETYLFFAIELTKDGYSRTDLSHITREVNRLFLMPVMILFKHDSSLTLSVISRRLQKRDISKDVLEKVTLIKDIQIKEPVRAHIDILFDLSFEELNRKTVISNFVQLHRSWETTLSISALNKKFYDEIITWFNNAIKEIKIPSQKTGSEKHKDFTIRLIARLIFIWFLKELKVVSEDLLVPRKPNGNDNDLIKPKNKGTAYYKFVLQNLFFNALNKEQDDRKETIKDFDIFTSFFEGPDAIKKLILDCPFLNGGLFDENENDYVSRNIANNAFVVPDHLFIGDSGLNSLLSRYKFTIAENTPLDEEIAVDPEMLGRIFENLLAEQSEDTQEAARRNAGAFYTPRPIVSYMCKNVLLRLLNMDITPQNGKAIVHSLLETKVIDPACGSGAFPMGMLEEMMNVLEIADPEGRIWFGEMLKSKDENFREHISDFIADNQVRYVKKLGLLRNCLFGIDILEYAVEITKLRCWLSLIVEQKVDFSKHNYNLKPLPNLEFKFYKRNSLLRTFKGQNINLMIDVFDKDNLLDELVELENSYFIAKSDKCGTKEEIKQKIILLLEGLVDNKIQEIEKKHKTAVDVASRLTSSGAKASDINNARKKAKKFAELLGELVAFKNRIKDYFIERVVFPDIFSTQQPNPGFDIVIGNPPYVNTKLINQMGMTDTLKEEYGYCDDLYNHFTLRGMELLKQGGFLSYITSDTFLTIQTKENMRRLFLGLSPMKHNQENKDQTSIFNETYNGSNCRLLEIINTPKAFAAMVDTAIFNVQKQTPVKHDTVTYIDIRFPNADSFGLTNEEWQAIKESANNIAGWEKVLNKIMLEVQLPISKTDEHQSKWIISHTCNDADVLVDSATRIEKYRIPLSVYHQSLNYSLFAPNKWNCKVFDKVIKPVFPLFSKWWNRVDTSKAIEENRTELQKYIKLLKAGDFTILGLITDGGVGLQTGDNGRFVGALYGTKVAERIAATRPEKLKEAVDEHPGIRNEFKILKDCNDVTEYKAVLDELTEHEIRELFDKVKAKYGRRVFGKGYIYRVIDKSEMGNVNDLSDDEKLNGIKTKGGKEIYVPYDKGDKEGNRWYLETPYGVCWNKSAVEKLQTSREARWQGYNFFFQNGFCWTPDGHLKIPQSWPGQNPPA